MTTAQLVYAILGGIGFALLAAGLLGLAGGIRPTSGGRPGGGRQPVDTGSQSGLPQPEQQRPTKARHFQLSAEVHETPPA